jgi:DNA-binding NarL/FixJ family response regulator
LPLLALEEDFEVVAQAQDGRQVLDVCNSTNPTSSCWI